MTILSSLYASHILMVTMFFKFLLVIALMITLVYINSYKFDNITDFLLFRFGKTLKELIYKGEGHSKMHFWTSFDTFDVENGLFKR